MPGGAPVGNRNNSKGRKWYEALVKALAQYEAGDVRMGEALFKIANKVVALALDGDKDCIQEIANRLDGKPAVSVELTGDALLAVPVINVIVGESVGDQSLAAPTPRDSAPIVSH